MLTQAAMVSADGAAPFGPVEVLVFVGETRSGLKEWHGSFVLPPNVMLLGTESLQFKFESKRSGTAVVRRVESSSSGMVTVHFGGSGPFE
jgi:hypothetical protein